MTLISYFGQDIWWAILLYEYNDYAVGSDVTAESWACVELLSVIFNIAF